MDPRRVKKQVSITDMDIKNMELMHECSPEHLRMGINSKIEI